MMRMPTTAQEMPSQRSRSVLEAKVRSQKWDYERGGLVGWFGLGGLGGKGELGTYEEEIVG
jgi:hypothetical protein